jgi:hypothetical protein
MQIRTVTRFITYDAIQQIDQVLKYGPHLYYTEYKTM